MVGALAGTLFHYLRFGRNEAPEKLEDEREGII
jgi:hypothetical protein